MAENQDHYLNLAFEEAFASVRSNNGGPFGAVIVKDGQIVGKGANRVTSLMDPTAHAEITAIRDACSRLGTFDLTGAVLYSTCEPCPMCFSAIYWAGISEVFFVSTRHDAAAIGFRDNHIYQELSVPLTERTIPFHHVESPLGVDLFNEWRDKADKVAY
jgi:tRNA(Arg) A34 adenosine deaminase TadA